ncbi:DUF1254 domain-containing protein [Clostridioides sp. ES-S-0010-02]|uniref:DUF1254 domain-containing protein n=1 Tax=Clostridioides sp. ES-S-0010-02 TaxID=2770776 RepID=UPI001D117EF3|nr:DUF1254 domain-containing protein [Clostridioides sp. ES-S-0010-02]
MKENNTKKEIVDVYVQGYPVVGMYELLYTQVVNPETKTTKFNEFEHTASVASPKTSFIPAPNNDTTYSRAWLDLRKEPVVIEVPDTEGRYYSIQLLNFVSETLTNVGKRTTGTSAKKFVIVGPDWNGNLPDDYHLVRSDTSFVLAFLRILINNELDIEIVKDIQNKITVKSISEVEINDIESLPVYKNSTNKEFFETLENVLQISSMPKNEKDILKEVKEINELPVEVIEEACSEAKKLIDEGGMRFGEEVNFWRIASKGIGNYGTDYLQRAVVWYKGALANQPQESLYPSTFQDSNGQMLDGNFDYRLTFTSVELPPVSQFWSLTMYIFRNAFLYDNQIDRYSIGDRTKGLIYEEDGSLTIYIQNKEPEIEEEKANWLPAPKEKFYMSLRLYGPDNCAIEGTWQPPAVKKVD